MPRLIIVPGMEGKDCRFDSFTLMLGARLSATVLRYPRDAVLDHPELQRRLLAELPRNEPFILLGESFGGPLAISLAACRPPGLAAVVLCASFARLPQSALLLAWPLARFVPVRAIPSSVLSWFVFGGWVTPTMRAELVESLASVPFCVLRARLESALRVDVTADLADLELPLLYLRASHDRIIPRAAGDQILRLARNAHLAEIEGPHFLLQAAPEACGAAIRRFVRGQC